MPQAESEAQRIFHAALAISSPGERAAFLKGACGADADMRGRVEALLSAYEQVGEFLSRPEHAAATTEQAGQMIGRYKLLEPLGEGGFGSVWMAEQREPVRRRVALKVIKLGMDTKQVIARFEAERQALALMDHPHIAKVLDAGATETGRPFFVMELVRGVPILEYCDKEKLDTERRLGLFGSVCHAIQHAHQKGIIHRDIKPSNVLVTMHDGVPVPKVIDFGIAKATNSELTQKTLFTEHRQMIGTPAYMSPEQAEMSGLDIDTRADIYSLGVLLYELLTGTTPFDVKQLLSQGFAEMMRAIREDEPHKPSTRISTLGDTAARTAQQRDVDVRRLGLLLRGDLDWIVMKCLEKDRTRRYETANGLAADIQRHLDGEPVVAAPPSRTYRVRKFVKRNRAAVIAGGTIALVLVAGIVGTSWGMLWAVAEKGRADLAAKAETTANTQAQANAAKALVEAQRAEEEAQHARTAEASAKQRASELEQVSKFQAGMLSQVDPTTAGVRLTADLKAKFEAALVKAGVAEAERAGQLEAFAVRWRRVNATDAARELIDATILRPAVATIEKDFKDQPLVDAQLRQALADLYWELGLYDAALPLQEQALTTRRQVLGNEHPETLTSIDHMGLLLQSQGYLAPAEWYYSEALATRRRVLGDESPATLTSLSNMGSLCLQQFRLTQAEVCYREALEKSRRVLGEEHPSTLNSINNMGRLLQDQGKLDEAEPFFCESLEKSRRLLGEEDRGTLTAIGNMGGLLQDLGRLREAEPYVREALEKRRRVLGEENPDTLNSIHQLGGLLQSLNRLSEAEPYLTEALEKRRRLLGEDSYDTLFSIHNMGLLRQAQNRLGEAEALFREALERCPHVLKEDHAYTLSSIYCLSSLLQTENKLDEAEPLIRDALEMSRRVFGDDNRNTLNGITNMGTLRQAQGRRDQAEAYFREALEKSRSVLGEEHTDTIDSIINLASVLVSMGNLEEADPLIQEVLEKGRRLLGEANRSTLSSIIKLCRLLIDRGEVLEAEPYIRFALIESRRVLGDEDPITLASLNNMGFLLLTQGKRTEAEPYLREALDKRRRVLGENDRDTLISINNMGCLLQAQGKLTLAEPYLREALEKSRRLLGEDDPDTIGSINNMGALLQALGKPAEAEACIREVLERARRVWSGEDMRTLRTLISLGDLLMGQGRLSEAEPFYREALKKCRHAYGDAHPDTLIAIDGLGMLLLTKGNPAEAEPLLREFLDRARGRLAADDPELAEDCADVGLALIRQHKFVEAEPLVRESLAILTAKQPDDWTAFDARSLVGASLAGQGRHDEADPLLVEGFQKMEPPARWAIRKREALERLIEHYEAWGKPEEAAHYRKLLEAQTVPPAAGGK